ncbi:manganese-dependent inorganic pyrophosphatase [Levilactobacillus bambusae]|uniref:Probable manganese-dependent inorganic pyrophosphatase n=1 Tax=Levilactobacillus bambusae TaxID=2024736 RepID=A0A2V1N2H8_9LACO|nr:manganese-dependent inorganic pyrophosphatase [Levilactobacillus bambusae]PWG00828.1 manganese-dependent inorganic pyrophosphatase [Levilactobacillus bambusae]
MSKELVFGHQKPDTDAIVAAKAFAYLQNKLGKDVEAVALGEPNAETVFALNHFAEPMPRIIKAAKPEVDEVMLVDHNEPQQSVSDLADVTVTDVVDHHRINGFNTAQPLNYRAEAIGCTSTIITEMFIEEKIDIPVQLAGLMLSAIISDTLLLKSPTTTDKDREIARFLAQIADIDMESYGIDLLKAGTDLASKSDKELIDTDAKSYDLNGTNTRIAQINTVDLNDVLSREDGIKQAMSDEMASDNYQLFLVLATNVLDSNSELIVVGDHQDLVEKAFNTKLNNGQANLPGVVSRKKQLVPPLTETFNA